jgi:hypothetical protein
VAEKDRLLNERLGRILTLVALKKPDRVPVVLEYAGLAELFRVLCAGADPG